MPKVVIAGGGFAGCAAAITARKAGAEVVVFEKIDELLGTGLAGGVMRNNGRFTAAEEAIAMGGGGAIFQVLDSVSPYRNVDFPGHKHASVYNRLKAEPAVKAYLNGLGIEIRLETRIVDVGTSGKSLTGVVLEDKEKIEGDVFVDATGTSGPMGLCTKHGNGCVMCILRCPTFGGRVSLAAKAGIKEVMGRNRNGGFGAMTGAFDIHKDTIGPAIRKELDDKGVVVVPLPKEDEDLHANSLRMKTCQQYALREFAENLVILNNGFGKVHTTFVPLHELRRVPGFESAHIAAPLAGSRGNSIRYLGMAPRDNTLKVEGLDNLFCGGEKAGVFVGHTEAIITGSLAGHNAARWAMGLKPLEMPRDTLLGDIVAYVREQMQTEEGLGTRFTFSGGKYFERVKESGLYTTDVDQVRARVERQGLLGIFDRKPAQEAV